MTRTLETRRSRKNHATPAEANDAVHEERNVDPNKKEEPHTEHNDDDMTLVPSDSMSSDSEPSEKPSTPAPRADEKSLADRIEEEKEKKRRRSREYYNAHRAAVIRRVQKHRLAKRIEKLNKKKQDATRKLLTGDEKK